jgi:hypothetical protein
MTEAVAQASAAAKQTSGTLRINTLGMAARQVIAPRLGLSSLTPGRDAGRRR